MLKEQYIHYAMPDFSGIAFFELATGETSFFTHANLSCLVFLKGQVDWVKSFQRSSTDDTVSAILEALSSNGYLKRPLLDS